MYSIARLPLTRITPSQNPLTPPLPCLTLVRQQVTSLPERYRRDQEWPCIHHLSSHRTHVLSQHRAGRRSLELVNSYPTLLEQVKYFCRTPWVSQTWLFVWFTRSSKLRARGFVPECLFIWLDLQTQLTPPTGFHEMTGQSGLLCQLPGRDSSSVSDFRCCGQKYV